MTHTPGPWTAQHDESGYAEWEIEAGEVNVGSIHSMSDARLIAAAPELLEALRQMVVNSEGDRKQYRDCHKKAVAAIAKAEGR